MHKRPILLLTLVLTPVFALVLGFCFIPVSTFAEVYAPTTPTPEPLPTDATDFVTNLFQCILLRPLDSSFISTYLPYWTNYVQSSNANIENTFQDFFTTSEYINDKTSDQEFVNQLFDCILYRPGDAPGLSYWVSQLQRQTRSQLITDFLTSQEYIARIQGNLRAAVAATTSPTIITVSATSTTPTPTSSVVATTSTNTPASSPATRMVFANYMLNVPLTYTTGQGTASLYAEDVANAQAEGLDGFIMDTFTGTDANVGMMMDAAQEVDPQFKLFIEIDEGVPMSASEIISLVETYGKRANYLQQNGKPVLTVWEAQDYGHDASWWQSQVLTPLASAGYPVYFIPFFDLPDPNSYAPTFANYDQYVYSPYGSIVDGMYEWIIPKALPFSIGQISQLPNASWSLTDGLANFAAVMKSHGKAFMSTVTPYYWANCHSVRQYYEFEGGFGLENQWLSIINQQQPQWVEEATWNDYTESTYFSPSQNVPEDIAGIPNYSHAGYYELSKYYISWYKRGTQPPITQDALFYFYRPQSKSALTPQDASDCSIPIQSQYLIGDVEDDLYVTTMLTAPATLEVTSGSTETSYNVPAGITNTDIPFSVGSQTFELWRNGVRIATTQGTNILSAPQTRDFNNTSGFVYANPNATPQTCTPDWSCSGWNQCALSGVQSRTCTDLNACNTTVGEPTEAQACTYISNATTTATTTPSIIETLKTEIASLISELAQLESLHHIESTSNASCPILSRNLAQGSSGADVSTLQTYFVSLSLLSSESVTGYFGPLTQAAVQQWQQSHGIVSAGSPAATGWGAVGPKTRTALSECSNI